MARCPGSKRPANGSFAVSVQHLSRDPAFCGEVLRRGAARGGGHLSRLGGSTASTSSSRWRRDTSGSRRGSRSSRSGCAGVRATPRFRPRQDPPSAPPRPRKPSSGRSPGGQPGHEGTEPPAACRSSGSTRSSSTGRSAAGACGHRFGEDERDRRRRAVQRHQVSELPPIAVTVTEHRLHRLRCPACAAETRAELPAERARAAPSARACRRRSPRSRSATASPGATRSSSLRELFGAELATGTVDAIVQRAGEALARALRRSCSDHVRSAPAVNVDETGWRLRGGKRTLWGALTPRMAVFRIAPDRHEREAKALLGERLRRRRLLGPLVGLQLPRPRAAPALLGAPRARLHRPQRGARRAEGVRRGRPRARRAAVRGLGRAPARRRPRPAARARSPRSSASCRTLLERSARKSTKTKYHRLFANNLLKLWPALWTFTLLDGVEPTNNHAERGLRGAVIYRKLSLGSQSEQGERTIERLLSASVTCRLQRRSLFAYLTDVLNASIRGDPIPALT